MTAERFIPTIADRVAAALSVYADAIRYGHTPVPDFITIHAADIPWDTFMALADRTDAKIEIVQPMGGVAYARLPLPFGAGILPAEVEATVHATCRIGDSEKRHADIGIHNHECVFPDDGEPNA